MELGHLDGMKILITQANGVKILLREKVSTNGPTDEIMMVNGKIVIWKEEDYISGQMEANILETL